MKTAIFLVMVSVCLAKPPTRSLPDFLAPFRGIFGSSAGTRGAGHSPQYHHPPPTSHQQPDSAGAETGKPGYESNDDGFRPFSPGGPFANYGNSYDGGNFVGDSGPPPQYSPGSSPSGNFHSEGRPAPYQFQQSQSRPPQFHQSNSRPPPQFHHSPPSVSQRKPVKPHQRPTYHHQPHPQHHRPQFPEFQQQQHHQSPPSESGFSDFAFNPADFERGEEKRNFYPSKQIGSFGGPGGPPQQDYAETSYRSGPNDIITLADLQKGQSENGVYFDEVYRSPPPPPSRLFGAQPIRGRPFPSSSEESSYEESRGRGRKVLFNPGHSHGPLTPEQDVHYGKPMLMSASATPTTVVKAGARKARKPKILGPKFEAPKQNSELIASASATHGSDSYGGGASADRILYHVSGDQGPYSYRFGYDTGAGSYNRMWRHEEKDANGNLKGKYGYYDHNGKLQVVNYSATPKGGFHAERAH